MDYMIERERERETDRERERERLTLGVRDLNVGVLVILAVWFEPLCSVLLITSAQPGSLCQSALLNTALGN